MINIITKTIKFGFLGISLLWMVSSVSAQPVLLTSGTSWTVPPGVFKITVECWGGGGGGGWGDPQSDWDNVNSHYLPYVGGGGGGGGAYARSVICVTPGTTYNISVGAGGSGGQGTNHGGDTWFGSATTVMAQGGRGVSDNSSTRADGGAAAASVGDVRYSGGRGAHGSSGDGWGGGGGGAGHATGNGSNAGGFIFGVVPVTYPGGGSSAPGGAGGDGRDADFSGSANGQNYGGGGGGCGSAAANPNGGNGASGAIKIVTESLTLDAGLDVTIASGGDHVMLNGSFPNPVPGISYTQDFNGCNNATCSGWTMDTGNSPSITATAANGYTPCTDASAKARIRENPFIGAPRNTAILTSNTSLGTSSGQLATLSFNYKCIDNTSGSATPASSCNFTAAWSIDGGTTWTNLPAFQNQSSATCVTTTPLTFTPPIGSEVRIRITAVRSSGDFWVVIDDINLTQPSLPTSISWSGGPVVSGETTATPTVNPGSTTVYTMSSVVYGCPLADNITVTVTSPLAVTLSDFSASCEDKKILWSTASEQNSSHFVVEQSRNGYDWSAIATVEGAGTTNTAKSYHINNDLSASYYRLKQVDFDGKYEYFGPIHVDCGTALSHELTAYPNPNNGTFSVEITSTEKLGDATVFMNDLSGKTIATRDITILSGTNTVRFENNDLMPGTYIIHVQGQEKNNLTPIRLVIQ